MAIAAVLAESATSDMLIGPDWSINLQLCDAIERNPGELKEALKVLKKRLGSKDTKIQMLTLYALETLTKNCGMHVFEQIIERDVLYDMVKIVKKTRSLNVKEKILSLIDAWQVASGGQRGTCPQFFTAYNDLRSQGMDFPPREDSSSLYPTPPANEVAPPESDGSSLSYQDIKNADGLANVLSEMLSALNPNDPEGAKQEVIADLVDQCRLFQKRVVVSAETTSDEKLLGEALTLNDNLQRVLQLHEDIANGRAKNTGPKPEPQLLFNLEDDDADERLFTRPSKNASTASDPLPGNGSPAVPLIPPPPSSKKQNFVDSAAAEFGVNPFATEQLAASPSIDFAPEDPLDEMKSSAASDVLPPFLPNERDELIKHQQPSTSRSSNEHGDLSPPPSTAAAPKDAGDQLFNELMDEFWKIKLRSPK